MTTIVSTHPPETLLIQAISLQARPSSTASIHIPPTTNGIPALMPVVPLDEKAADIPSWRRWIILFVTCWMALPVTFWSTSLLPVTEEISKTFGVEPTTINAANAGVFVAQASSALVWLPVSTLAGRRTTYLVANILMTCCAVGVALAPNMACFTVFWLLGGTTGPFFLVAGQTILADIFEPGVRGTAVGFFLGSTVSANALAPLVGSIIATYANWRVILATQGGMTLIGLTLAFFFIPKASELGNISPEVEGTYKGPRDIVKAFNPRGVFRQLTFPNILLANVTCGLLGCNQYAMLATVRKVIDPRFGLTSPLDSGLFYFAPGAGFLFGSIVGGRFSDTIVRWCKRKRNGRRVPEDRLMSAYPWILVILPAWTLLYGWSVDRKFGGLALPIIGCFMEGMGLMASFSSLNTYSAEVMPERRTATISSKYLVQYSFSAGSVGGMVPLINSVGVGWSFTTTAASALIGAILVLVITREWVLSWKKGVRS